MPAGQAVSKFGSGILFFTRDALRGIPVPCLKTDRFLFYTGCAQGRPCLGLGRVSFFTRDALRGIPCLKTGFVSLFSW